MKQVIEHLLVLQRLSLDSKRLTAEQEREINERRKKVPAPILDHFDRLVARGKKPIAMVRSGVCGECHLRISIGTLARVTCATEIQQCGNCGRFLVSAPSEQPSPVAPTAPPITPRLPAAIAPVRRTRTRMAAHAA